MPIDDRQLDELLRDVEVPGDLKANLLKIPDEDSKPERQTVSKSKTKSRFAIVGVIAAIAASVLVIVNLPSGNVAINEGTIDPIVANQTAERLLAEMKQDLEAIEEICFTQDVELAMRDALRVEPTVDFKESLSLAMSVPLQSALDQGLAIESIKPELEYVIASFPNTSGARQAQAILQNN